MSKVPKNAQKVFNHAKEKPGLSIYEISKDLGVDYKNTHSAVGYCEKMGFLQSFAGIKNNRPRREIFVVPELMNLDLARVNFEAGSKLLENKQIRRKSYFEHHGSMTLPVSDLPSLVLKKRSFTAW